MQPYNPRTDGITQSIVSGFMKCRVFSKLSLQGWTPLKTGAALQFGEMAHGVLENVYLEVSEGKRKTAPTQKEVYALIKGQVDAWEKSPRGQRAGDEQVQQLELNAALLEAVLPHYFRFWASEDFSKIQWVALEKEFEVELEIPIFGMVKLRGKIDGVYRDASKHLKVFETKTKGRIEEDSLSELLAFDFQTDYYAIACGKIWNELPTGARYNIVRRPGQKLSKKGETLTAFRQRVEKEVIDDPKHYFIRYQIDKPKKDLAEFKRQLEQKIKDLIDWKEGRLPTYRNETACMDRFGACRYLKICASQNYDGFYKRERMFEELGAGANKGGSK